MYNRYIGNTGKVYRVEEPHDKVRGVSRSRQIPAKPSAPVVQKESGTRGGHKKPLFGGIKLFESGLPLGLDTSDLIILGLLLFLFIESGDEEFLIILGFLAYSIFKDHKS